MSRPQTVRDLRARGATFGRAIRDDGFGFTTTVLVPGVGEVVICRAGDPVA